MSKKISTGYISAKINGITVKSNIKSHSGNYANASSRDIDYIVVHYTGNDDDNAENNAKYFSNNDIDVSAHFFTDETRIHQSVELRDVAWHCGGNKYYHSKCRNSNSIGIEMTTAGNYKISAKTIENTAHLCAYLCEMIGVKSTQVDTYILRHYDITHKKCPAQFVDNSKEWTAFKTQVKNILKAKENAATATTNKTNTITTTTKVLYRVRKTWKDSASQLGAFSSLPNAKKKADENPGYKVFDNNGKTVYTPKTATTKAVTVGCKVKVKKDAKDYNGAKVASFIYNNVYRVDQLNGKRAVLDLKGICTAFHIDNLIVQ
jgi:N-acetylmuramoyl-L-alanine amidase CwlA